MILEKYLDGVYQIKDVKFLWHFTNHRIHWDVIKEPDSEYNKSHNIITHTHLINHLIKRDFDSSLIKDKNMWVGCFGIMCIITKDCITLLNNKYNFINKFNNYTSNRDRRAAESIFPLLCYNCFNYDFHNSYDGLYYDGINVNKYNGIDTNFDGLKYIARLNYFSKISFDR